MAPISRIMLCHPCHHLDGRHKPVVSTRRLCIWNTEKSFDKDMASLGGAASIDALVYLDTGTRERYERVDDRGAYTAVLPCADIE